MHTGSKLQPPVCKCMECATKRNGATVPSMPTDRFDPDKHPNFTLNANQIRALAERVDKLYEPAVFVVGMRYNKEDSRTVVVRFYNFGQPGWTEVDIDQNGDVFRRGTGGLD